MSPVQQVRYSSGLDGPTLVDRSYCSQQGTLAHYGQLFATPLGTERAAA
jgi:hypothetical protein